MLIIFLLVIAVSLDCWGTGLAYGLQNIGIKKTAIILIGVASMLIFAAAMAVGEIFAGLLSEQYVHIFGALLVIMLGIYALLRNNVLIIKHEKMFLEIAIGRVGILVRVINDKSEADLDRSGIISTKEACYLAMALSLDAFGVGIGAALLELSWLASSMAVGIGAAASLGAGLYMGRKIGERIAYEKLRALPGIILIMIGLIRLMKP